MYAHQAIIFMVMTATQPAVFAQIIAPSAQTIAVKFVQIIIS